MKMISVKEYFTVMWNGFCQAIGWVLKLFGYKGEGVIFISMTMLMGRDI